MFQRMASSLGIPEKDFYNSIGCCTPEPESSKRIIFPSISLRGKQLDLSGIDEPQVGQVITATVKLRVSSVSSDSSDKGSNTRCELEVKELEVSETTDPEDSEESDDSEPKDKPAKKMPSAKDVLS